MNSRFAAVFFLMVLSVIPVGTALAQDAERSPLMDALHSELDRSFAAMEHANDAPLYYLRYQVTDIEQYEIAARYGAVVRNDHSRDRVLDVECRVGDYQLDNTHEIRGEFESSGKPPAPELPLDNDLLAIRTIAWRYTDVVYKAALERYTKVKTNQQVLVEREDTSADFSRESPHTFIGETKHHTLDPDKWQELLRQWSALFKEHAFVHTSGVSLSLSNNNRCIVDSDGAEIQTGQSYARLAIHCSGIADDGMNLRRTETFDAASVERLPEDREIEKAIHRMIAELEALLQAPLAEPYAGPAILVNRASGVFFHEIFGHRIEGHRQKSEREGQTFTRRVGESVLPEFISVYDDPTIEKWDETFLRGHYVYDDEGVPAQRVVVVDDGILKNFLMSRSPINNYPHSNGHGRKQPGRSPVSRQGNLVIESSKQVPFETLQEMLLTECQRQGKPYGLIFYDISGGFTMTGRYGPQSFKVIPLLVYRVYADGREPEPIRGVDIVGTPLSSFDKIMATGNDYGVFNGTCGAESGWVPVSAISPSILVSQVEIEKKAKEQEKPPLLPPPYDPSEPQGALPQEVH